MKNAPFRRHHWLIVSGLAAALLSACGGGGGNGEADAGSVLPVTAVANVAIDPRLPSGSTALAVVSVQSLVDSRPTGSGIAYREGETDAPVFGLDSTGEVLLATRVSNGSASFTAEGTVRYLAALVLSTFRPDEAMNSLEGKVGASSHFAEAVTAFNSAFANGTNPAQDATFKAALSAMVNELRTTSATASTASSDTGRKAPQALPPDRLDPANKDPVDSTIALLQTFSGLSESMSVQLSNELAPAPARFLLWNATPVYWDAQSIDVDGTARNLGQLEPPSFAFSLIGIGQPLDIGRPTQASFAVEVVPSYEANARKMAKSIIDLLKNAASIATTATGSNCIDTISTDLAFSDVKSTVDLATTDRRLINGFQALLVAAPNILISCLGEREGLSPADLAKAVPRLFKVVDWVSKFADVTEVGLQALIWRKYANNPVSKGVCVSQSGILSACLSSISSAFGPPPFAAGSPGTHTVSNAVRFYDRGANPISRPGNLTCSFEPAPGSMPLDIGCELAEGGVDGQLTYFVSYTGNPANGVLRMKDAATDAFTDIPVKVGMGRLDPANVTVAEGETIELTLREADGYAALKPPILGLAFGMTNLAAADVNYRVEDGVARILVTGKLAGQSSTLIVRNAASPGLQLASTQVRVLPRILAPVWQRWVLPHQWSSSLPCPLRPSIIGMQLSSTGIITSTTASCPMGDPITTELFDLNQSGSHHVNYYVDRTTLTWFERGTAPILYNGYTAPSTLVTESHRLFTPPEARVAEYMSLLRGRQVQCTENEGAVFHGAIADDGKQVSVTDEAGNSRALGPLPIPIGGEYLSETYIPLTLGNISISWTTGIPAVRTNITIQVMIRGNPNFIRWSSGASVLQSLALT